MSLLLLDKNKLLTAYSILFTRIVRGFLARRKVIRIKNNNKHLLLLLSKAAIKIQSIIKMFIVRCRYPAIGVRYRTKKNKIKKYLENNNNTKTTIMGIDGDYNLSRRKSFLFLKLKFGDLNYINDLDKVVVIIQQCWSNYNIYKKYKLKRQQRFIPTIIKIQRYNNNNNNKIIIIIIKKNKNNNKHNNRNIILIVIIIILIKSIVIATKKTKKKQQQQQIDGFVLGTEDSK